MAVVELLLSPLPAHVRTARLVTAMAARRAGLDDELLDELRFAVGEACSRAVHLHSQHAPGTPVRITVEDGMAGLTVTVLDAGPAAGPAPADVSAGMLADEGDDGLDPDVSLALVTGLVDSATVEAGVAGTTVRMSWPLPALSRGPGATAVSV